MTLGKNQSFQLLEDVVTLLDATGVPSMVCGAAAFSLYAIPRVTKDADAIISLGGLSITPAQVAEHIRSAGYRVRVSMGFSDDPIACVIIVEDDRKNKAELLIGIRGFKFAESYPRARELPFAGRTLKIVPPEDLIGMKLFAGSEKDFSDVKILLRSGLDLNQELLEQITRRFGSYELELLKKFQVQAKAQDQEREA